MKTNHVHIYLRVLASIIAQSVTVCVHVCVDSRDMNILSNIVSVVYTQQYLSALTLPPPSLHSFCAPVCVCVCFNVLIFVDIVKRGVLILVDEIYGSVEITAIITILIK